jgi:uroporphyrinogen decarboxylase
MDPIEAKKRFGDRLTLHGLISVQTTLPHGTEQEVRDTVRKYIDECGLDGGLILSTTNDALEDIPLENLLAFYDEAKSYSKELYAYQAYEERR